MERQNFSMGRGRPAEGELRRPLNMVYGGAHDFVPHVSNDHVHNDLPQNEIGPNGDAEMHFRQVQSSYMQSPNTRPIPEKKFELSPYAQEFVPRNFRPDTSQSDVSTDNNFDDQYPIQELKTFMYEITSNPAMFESKVQALADCFMDTIQTDECLQNVLNIIFNESVQQPNFRYNGARLASFLCTQLTLPAEKYNFKQVLLDRCHLEVEHKEHLAQASDGGAYLRGYAMFLAELMSQIEVPNPRVPLFGDSLAAVLKTLLDHSSYDNLKCICQILKLVGSYMEDAERNKSSKSSTSMDMEKLINMLKVVSDDEEYTRDIRAMVTNVVELRSNNWGRSTEDDSTTEDDSPPSPLNEPVMYGPDGKPITAEESQFLHTQYSYNASDAEDFDGFERDEMDDEIEAAYEVFLNELAQ